VLRHFPKKLFKSIRSFTTTIFVLISAAGTEGLCGVDLSEHNVKVKGEHNMCICLQCAAVEAERE
jgi:hypothetical protein